MSKISSCLISIMILALVAAVRFNIYGQAEDYCGDREMLTRSTFNGTVLYGPWGATSQLDREKNFEKYKPGNAFDGDTKTAWVEGKEDDGQGESLAFFRTSPVKKIGILPGYGTVKHFNLNNRVKSARLSVFSIDGRDADQCTGMHYDKGKLLKSEIINFEDSMKIQYFNPDEKIEQTEGYIYAIEIISVYKGSKYSDTCISEITAE